MNFKSLWMNSQTTMARSEPAREPNRQKRCPANVFGMAGKTPRKYFDYLRQLRIATPYFPGWTATVAGQAAPLIPVDGALGIRGAGLGAQSEAMKHRDKIPGRSTGEEMPEGLHPRG